MHLVVFVALKQIRWWMSILLGLNGKEACTLTLNHNLWPETHCPQCSWHTFQIALNYVHFVSLNCHDRYILSLDNYLILFWAKNLLCMKINCFLCIFLRSVLIDRYHIFNLPGILNFLYTWEYYHYQPLRYMTNREDNQELGLTSTRAIKFTGNGACVGCGNTW